MEIKTEWQKNLDGRWQLVAFDTKGEILGYLSILGESHFAVDAPDEIKKILCTEYRKFYGQGKH